MSSVFTVKEKNVLEPTRIVSPGGELLLASETIRRTETKGLRMGGEAVAGSARSLHRCSVCGRYFYDRSRRPARYCSQAKPRIGAGLPAKDQEATAAALKEGRRRDNPAKLRNARSQTLARLSPMGRVEHSRRGRVGGEIARLCRWRGIPSPPHAL